ncbi:MAG: CapA family protein, partial [Caulobacteraceae bacterium]|nr:CapA family protein [Caulobacteraceae bacterium]
VGHGPHVLRGIEIYKGKPIFYSLGDFAFDINLSAQPVGADIAEARGVDLTQVTGPEFTARGWDAIAGPSLFESVIAVSRFDGNKLSEVTLHPIDLGWERRAADRGYPRMASPDKARKILEDVQRLSSRYGTQVRIEDNLGFIRPRARLD